MVSLENQEFGQWQKEGGRTRERGNGQLCVGSFPTQATHQQRSFSILRNTNHWSTILLGSLVYLASVSTCC